MCPQKKEPPCFPRTALRCFFGLFAVRIVPNA
jgi:hypothetical protein